MSFVTNFRVTEVNDRVITLDQIADDTQITDCTIQFSVPEGSGLPIPEEGSTVSFNGHYSVISDVNAATADGGDVQAAGETGTGQSTVGDEGQGEPLSDADADRLRNENVTGPESGPHVPRGEGTGEARETAE